MQGPVTELFFYMFKPLLTQILAGTVFVMLLRGFDVIAAIARDISLREKGLKETKLYFQTQSGPAEASEAC